MSTSLPYLASNKNVSALFEKISMAKVPSKFTQDFLQNTIGLKGNNDRSFIPLLRNMGFLDQSNTPTSEYSRLKNRSELQVAIAEGVRRAYQPLFNANEAANELSGERLKGLVSQVSGADADMSARIASTFSVLAKLGDFSGTPDAVLADSSQEEGSDDVMPVEVRSGKMKGLRTEFHYNIQIHLPANGTEENYINIFNAIRKTFQ